MIVAFILTGWNHWESFESDVCSTTGRKTAVDGIIIIFERESVRISADNDAIVAAAESSSKPLLSAAEEVIMRRQRGLKWPLRGGEVYVMKSMRIALIEIFVSFMQLLTYFRPIFRVRTC